MCVCGDTAGAGVYICILQLKRQVAWMLYDDDNGLLDHTGEAQCELLLPVQANTDI